MDHSNPVEHNREAWNRRVAVGNRWTVPVSAEQVAQARLGTWSVVLTPQIAVPRQWFPASLRGLDVLCLASGGGQQGPILAAAGARVTVLDYSDGQLEKDREVAERDQLELNTIHANMLDLDFLPDESFDLVFHPCSNTFVPTVLPVWRACHRILRRGGRLLSGFCNPARYVFEDERHYNGVLQARYRIPFSDEQLPEEVQRQLEANDEPLEFGHTLDDLVGGQLGAGFVLRGFFEDRFDPNEDPISQFLPTFIATWAEKPRGT